MKPVVTLLSLMLFISGLNSCSVLTEEYRFKKRFDRFYEFLSKEEQKAFSSRDLGQVSLSLEQRISADTNLIQEWREIKDGEAITTFSTADAVQFYYSVILKEIHRSHFPEFMALLDAETQYQFAMGQGYTPSLERLYQENRAFQKLTDRSKEDHRLYGFSNEAVWDFWQEISYPEFSRRELYYVLAALQQVKSVEAFIQKDLDTCTRQLEAGFRSGYLFQKQFDALRKRSTLSRLDTRRFLEVYYDIAFRQMDKEAAQKTIAKFRQPGL